MTVQYGAIQTLNSTVTTQVNGTASSAYTSGNVVGGLLTFTNALNSVNQGVLQNIVVTSKSVQTAGLKLYVFSAMPSNTTFTDKTAPSINAADIDALVGVYTLGTADSGIGTATLYQLDGIGKAILGTSQNLYGVLVTTGTPTLASTTDLKVKLSVLW
jgi:hypothetical protein